MKNVVNNNIKNNNIHDKDGNIKKEILEKIADDAITRNPLIYQRLSEI